LATIRGDAADASLFSQALALVRAQQIESDADLEPLLTAPPAGTNPEILRRLRSMYDAGGWVLLESAIADLPADLRWLFESGAVSIEQLAALHRTLGPTSTADLLAEIQRESIRSVPGLDETVQRAIGAALPNLRASIPRIPLGRALAIADAVLTELTDVPGVAWAVPAGSLRRGQDLVGDIEIVAPADNPAAVFERLARVPDLVRTLYRAPRRLYVLMDRVQVGVRCPPLASAGAALLHLTGSPAHMEKLRQHASERGRRLEPEGVFCNSAPPIAETEEAIYGALGLPWIPAEIREGDDEIAAAREGRLPALVTQADIRGDLHMHTHWSDGRDSVEAMVEACLALGYEYLAITDHSQHAASSRTLSIDGITQQAEEIAELRERYPQIAILHGCEVDIMGDGTLDFADRILERFDIVLASLHEGLGQTPEQLMHRYLATMHHPLVTLITHPTNRLIPFRRGYDLDYDTMFAAAVETQTILEIDGAPPHLDMDGALARRAIAAGAMVSIDSDCHRAEMLGRQMELGILTARRGWVEPRHVVNTRSIAEVRALIARKRAS
jgi:DNA polymerase (family 10)